MYSAASICHAVCWKEPRGDTVSSSKGFRDVILLSSVKRPRDQDDVEYVFERDPFTGSSWGNDDDATP